MKRTAISVIGMGLKFPRGNLSIKTIRGQILSLFSRKKPHDNFIALEDVNFEVTEGEVVGIIGRNGAGKSTLLRVISGIYAPDYGSVKVRGKASLLASVGIGFNRELTGRENVYLYGAIIGIERKLIEAKISEIVEFSQLEDFIDAPLKTYSSGMKARLGFSVAANLDADILLIDEVFGVGDTTFRERSKTKIFQMVREANRTVVIVTHSSAILRQLCDRVLLVDDGRIISNGTPDEMIEAYEILISDGKGPSRSNRNRDAVLGPAAIQRAVILMRRGQFEDSRALLEANLASGKNTDAVRFHLGQLCVERGDHIAACQHWNYINFEHIGEERRLKRIGGVAKEYDLGLAYKVATYALARDPDKSWAWQILEAVVRNDDVGELILSLPTLAPLIFKENSRRTTTIARLSFNLGKFSYCAVLCETLNTSSPKPRTLELEGKAWNRLKNHDAALRCWSELIELGEEVEKNIERGARAAFNASNYLKSFEYAMRLHGIRPGTNQNLVLASRAASKGNLLEEREMLLNQLETTPRGSRDAWLNICKAYHELDLSEQTEVQLMDALKIHPDDIEFNILTGRLLMKNGSVEKAIKHFKRAQDIEPHRADIAIYLARAYRRLGRFNLAIITLRGDDGYRDNLSLQMLLGNILSEAEDWAGSLEIWENIKSNHPERRDIVLKIANCYLKLNRLSEAENLLQTNMNDSDENFKGLTMLRQVYWKQSRHEDALEIFKRLLNLDLQNVSLWKNVITLSARLSRHEDVRIYLQRLNKQFLKQEFGQLKLALIYQSLSLESKMRNALEEFRLNSVNKPNILYNAAKDFYDLDRADIAFILADDVTKTNSKHRKAGLLMTKIFSHLYDAGLNENWLLEQFEACIPVSITQMAIRKMILNSGPPQWQNKTLDSVAFVAHSVGIGGAERQIINTIKGFEKHISPIPKISLYCTEWSDKEDKASYRRFINESITELKTIVAPTEKMMEAEEDLIATFGRDTLSQIPKNLCREIMGLYQQFKDQKPSVVHAFHDRINVVAGIAAVLAGVPRIVLSTRSVSKHGTESVNPFARPLWYREAYKILLQRPQVQLYHVSKAVSKTYDDWLQLEKRQQYVLYNSTDYDLMRESSSETEFLKEKKGIKINEDSLIVGGIMRFSSEKRPLSFIKTAEIVLRKIPNAKFIMLGDGPLMDQAARLIRRLNLNDKIHLIGRSHQIYHWLDKFDAILLTSEFEGLPNVLIEAQGFGVPVISTNAGGASETFIETETGFLVNSKDEEAIATKVIKVLLDKEWRKKAYQLSKRNARSKFSIETAASNFINLYSEIESTKPPNELVRIPIEAAPKPETTLFVYVDDRNGKAALLSSAARNKGLKTYMVRDASQVPNENNSFVYFFIDHLNYRDRDKELAEGFAALSNIRMAPSIQELRVYDDKGAQQIEYGMIMPPALYSNQKGEAEKFIETTDYPFVSKAIEGAHASNVRLVMDKKQALDEIEAIFSSTGRARHDSHIAGLTQQGYVLWQKFLPDNPNDWRLIMLGGKFGMVVHRKNREDLPFASGSGLRTPENELTPRITAMLNWARDFVLQHEICVLAADVILDENEDFVLVETSTTWPTVMHEGNIVFELVDGEWIPSTFKGPDIFELKANMILNDEFHIR